MAISLSFGVLFATLITLLLVPCTYLVLEDLRRIPRAISKFGSTLVKATQEIALPYPIGQLQHLRPLR